MPAARPLRSGDPERVGGHELLGVLGEGGQGTVYLGRDPSGRQVAVKVLHARFAADDAARERFLREVRATRKVAQFCTARVFEVDVDQDRPYIVSEYVDGVSLEELVRREGPRDGDAVNRIAVGTAAALAAIHRAGIVHRDFKPANVLLGPDGPRVIDFGIARALDATFSLTGGVLGTPAYMSPEQLAGERVDTPSDLFSWAVTMAFAATGRPAFGADTIPAIMNRILYRDPDLSGVPDSIRSLLAACLAKRPEDRPAATEVLLVLLGHAELPGPLRATAELLAQETITATRPAEPPAEPASPEPSPAPTLVEPRSEPTPDESPSAPAPAEPSRTLRYEPPSDAVSPSQPAPRTAPQRRPEPEAARTEPQPYAASGSGTAPVSGGTAAKGGPRRGILLAGAAVLVLIGVIVAWSLRPLGEPSSSGDLPVSGPGLAEASIPAEASAPAAERAVPGGDGTLVVGTLLPQTGSLAFLGPPEFAGVKLAVKEINEVGGVLGEPVTQIDTDSGDTSTNIASLSVDSLLQQKADVVIGAASSSVSLMVIDKITGAGVLQISPANTSDEFTDYGDKGLYFRTAPPDVLQGRALGELIVADGNDAVAIMNLQDSYGTGLAASTKAAVEGAGGQVVEHIVYDPKAADFAAEVGKVKAAAPEAIALIGFEETKKIIAELVKQGLTADKVKWYFVDGNLANYGTGSDGFPKGTLKGAKGTQPGAQVTDAFRKRMLEADPNLRDFLYGPESYDAAIVTALAAEAAQSDLPTDIAAKLQDVTGGGEKCTGYQECLDLLKAGRDIDYDGVSGPIEFNEKGDPAQATIGIYEYDENNEVRAVDYHLSRLPA